MKTQQFMPDEILNASPEVQHHFLKMIADGQTEKWAVMCALQQAPGVTGCDRTFMQGRNNQEWLGELPARQANYMVKEAQQAGINTTGKYYMSGIADKRGWCDPEAWVSGRDDVLRVAKKRKLEVKGTINYTPPEEAAPPKSIDLNPRTVAREAKKLMQKDPSITKSQAVQQVKAKHVPRWKRRQT